MYFFPEAHAGGRARGRACASSLGMIVIDFPSAYGSDAGRLPGQGPRGARPAAASDPLVSFCLAPHAPYTVSDATFGKIATLAGELDVPVHMHLHETADEIERSLAEHGVRPLERLQRARPARPEPDRGARGAPDRRAKSRCSRATAPRSRTARRPTSSSRAASRRSRRSRRPASTSRWAPTARPATTVSTCSRKCALAALLAKAVARDAEALPAHAALRAATLGGAQALGLEARIGSIAPGKAADLVAVRPRRGAGAARPATTRFRISSMPRAGET